MPDKKEALIQEVIDYVQLAFRERIGRSTAQGYLAPLQKAVPNKMPVILPVNNRRTTQISG